MPPPSSFITISSVPFSQLVTQAMFNVANVQWFKYVAVAPIVIGLQTNEGGTFSPYVTIFQSDGTTPVGVANGGNEGWWRVLPSVGDYYIKVAKSAGTASDFDFTFTADTRPLDVINIVPGDLIVNDDANTVPGGFPAVILSSTGAVKSFISGIPSGEMGAILPSGTSFWHDSFGRRHATNRIAIFNANLGYMASAHCGIGLFTSNKPRFGTDITNDRVFLVNQDRELWIINSAGAVSDSGYIFPASPAPFPDVIAINETGTKLYWANTYSHIGVIHALDLTTFLSLPDFHTISGFIDGTDSIADTPNNHPGDMFVMPNGNLVTWWVSNDTANSHLIVINNSGSLLYTYTYTTPDNWIDHLAYIHEDSDHIIIWLYTNSGLSMGRFGRLTLSTGMIDQDFTHEMFSEGISSEGTAKFGPSNSCTFVRIQGSYTSSDIGGIYFINPKKATRHDSYYHDVERKIPDPTIKTALFGE